MNFDIPIYSKLVLEYIEAIQKQKLISEFGIDFENRLNEILPSEDDFLNYIEFSLNEEFQNNDEKYELEAKLKNNAIERVANRTKYEYMQYKSLLNATELQFRQAIPLQHLNEIPYSATLYSEEPDAELKTFDDLDKPIIFFHSELFSANLMFCKLFIQLIDSSEDEYENEEYKSFSITKNEAALKTMRINAIHFYRHYFSRISNTTPYYEFKTAFENNILAIFLSSISFFIYSHEVGHAMLKHYDNSEKETPQVWHEEFEADRFAMINLHNYCKVTESTNILTLLGPIIFFRFRLLLEHYRPEIGRELSHPPTMQRLENYQRYLRSKFSLSIEMLNAFLQFEEEASDYLAMVFTGIAALSPENDPEENSYIK